MARRISDDAGRSTELHSAADEGKHLNRPRGVRAARGDGSHAAHVPKKGFYQFCKICRVHFLLKAFALPGSA